MLRFFLYSFFKIFKEPYENIPYKKLTEFISNENLIEEILLKKKFQSQWRDKLGSKVFREHYSLKSLKVRKSSTYTVLITKFHHSFSFINSTIKKSCKEETQYIFIIKDMKILYMLNKEESPIEYNNLLQNLPLNVYNLTIIKNNSERNPLTNCLRNIDIVYDEFTKITSNLSRVDSSNPKYNLNQNEIIKYARKHALNYNKSYKSFDNSGGDCTNFVSQCLHAGGLPLSLTWKPYTNTWIRVNELYYYAMKIGFNTTESSSLMNPADVIQFHSIKKSFFSHSGIITEVLPNNDCLYCCHSYNKLDYPLSEVFPLFYNKIRFINIK